MLSLMLDSRCTAIAYMFTHFIYADPNHLYNLPQKSIYLEFIIDLFPCCNIDWGVNTDAA